MIRLEHVSRTFREKNMEVRALQDVSLHVRKGEIYGIVTKGGDAPNIIPDLTEAKFYVRAATVKRMMKVYRRLEDIVKGAALQTGCEGLLEPAQRNLIDNVVPINLLEGKTVFHNISIPLRMEGRPKEEIERRVSEVLDFVELGDKKNAYVSQLSGGQKQRVGIARALATAPEILLCDEATSALDPQTTESILKLLKRVNREMGITIMLITHQMQVIQLICDRVAVMEGGKVVEEGNVLDVFGRPQAEVTKRFVRTVINDQVPETFYDTIRAENRHYRLEQLKFIGDTVNEPVIANLCRREGLDVNIVGANISPMQGSMMSVFILQLIGETDRLNEAEEYMDRSGAIRKRLKIDWENRAVTETA